MHKPIKTSADSFYSHELYTQTGVDVVNNVKKCAIYNYNWIIYLSRTLEVSKSPTKPLKGNLSTDLQRPPPYGRSSSLSSEQTSREERETPCCKDAWTPTSPSCRPEGGGGEGGGEKLLSKYKNAENLPDTQPRTSAQWTQCEDVLTHFKHNLIKWRFLNGRV